MAMIGRRRWLQMAALAAIEGARGLRRAAASTHRPARRVVIVGGGFAGSACALYLRHLDPALDITLVDAVERYVTCPMSNEVLVGWRDLASITVPRAGITSAGIRRLRARAASIEAQQRCVRLEDGRSLAFDRLVVAPGIRLLWNRIEGYDELAAQAMPHAWQAGEQTQRLAQQLQGMADGGVVAISVPSGPMRCPPAPYERASLIANYLTQHKPRSKVLIFDANNRFPRQDLFTAAWRSLYPGMIEWIASIEDGAVVRVDAATLTLYTAHDAHPVAVANIIPPQAPGQFAADTGLASDHGWCPVVPDTFESQLIPNVHVIGDACIADAMPKSASAACSQARQCARAIVALLDGREPPSATLDSVCFSSVAPQRAFEIRGRFAIQDGSIVALTSPVESTAPARPAVDVALTAPGTSAAGGSGADAHQARAAQLWYRTIRATAFGS
jgi:sulfide dehydrogenase [flavocytochrome c] flavoprotein subunit